VRHRRHHRHHPHRQPRPSLEAIVRACGCDGEQLPAYLVFARELDRSFRHRPVPDFTERAKAVVAKYFSIGLSGRRLWLIGQALLRERFGPDPPRW
jgi:hypothetical protein